MFWNMEIINQNCKPYWGQGLNEDNLCTALQNMFVLYKIKNQIFI